MHASRCLLALALTCSVVTADAATLRIAAQFSYPGADGQNHPCRWCWCELRDYDPIRDDVIDSGFTDETGTVLFEYDSETDDGIGGGRIDPYVRCWSRLGIPMGGTRHAAAAVNKKRRLSITNLDLAYYEINTPRWDDNNEHRTVSVTASGEAGHAFFMLDCIARANRPPDSNPFAASGVPMSLGTLTLDGDTSWIIYPSLLGTKYSALTDEVLIGEEHESEFDAIVHEFGHNEMAAHYGGALGEYDRTEWGGHSFEGSYDEEWSAWCEGWANLCPVLSTGIPNYRGNRVEDASATNRSSTSEGTVTRVLWDIADTWRNPVLDSQGAPVPRAPLAGVVLDDDPFGFADCEPYNSLPGLDSMKAVIRTAKPKGLSEFCTAWRNEHGSLSAAWRALEAVLWANGGVPGDGIVNHPPNCRLTIEGERTEGRVVDGVRQPDILSGDLTLIADTHDTDALDVQFRHVYFYWSYLSPNTGLLYERDAWTPLAVTLSDTDGRFTWQWPRNGARPGRIDHPVVISAVASDHFQDSAFSLDPANLSLGQQGPLLIRPSLRQRAFMVELTLSAASSRLQLDVLTPGVRATVEEVIEPASDGFGHAWTVANDPQTLSDYSAGQGAQDTGPLAGQTCVTAIERPAGNNFDGSTVLRVSLFGVPDDGVVRFGLANAGDGKQVTATFRPPAQLRVAPRPMRRLLVFGVDGDQPNAHSPREYFDVDLGALKCEISIPLPPPPPPGG